jgi:HPt (histidine-containing phosphotransfer) domain-containing protein
MAKDNSTAPRIETFADHAVITPPNRLKHAIRSTNPRDSDDPVARAESALANLSGEFKTWMNAECDRLAAAYAAVLAQGFTTVTRGELFRAAHDIKGDAPTFGFPAAGVAADSLCRIIEHAPDLDAVPAELIQHHIDAVQAIVREHTTIEKAGVADELCARLRAVADDYLAEANKDRPEHLDALAVPSIAPTN